MKSIILCQLWNICLVVCLTATYSNIMGQLIQLPVFYDLLQNLETLILQSILLCLECAVLMVSRDLRGCRFLSADDKSQ